MHYQLFRTGTQSCACCYRMLGRWPLTLSTVQDRQDSGKVSYPWHDQDVVRDVMLTAQRYLVRLSRCLSVSFGRRTGKVKDYSLTAALL